MILALGKGFRENHIVGWYNCSSGGVCKWGVSSVEIFLQVNFAAPVSNSRNDVKHLNAVIEQV